VQTADAPSLQVSENELTACVTKQHFWYRLLIPRSGALPRGLVPVR